MASTINASNTGVGGIIQTADASGNLILQGGGIGGISIASDGTTTANNLVNIAEKVVTSATGANGTINFDVLTQSVLYYTANATGNWTVNFRGSSGSTLNSVMANGQAVTTAFLATQGASAYYNSALQVDGVSVTPKWQGGTAPTAGNASGIDGYAYTIVKTGNTTFTVLAAQTQYK